MARAKPVKKAAKPKKPSTEKPATRLGNVKSGDDRWWDLIERAGRDSEGPDEQVEVLTELLTKELSVAEIIAFDTFVQEKIRDAFRWELWAIAYIMNGGCSDDGFDYFCGWLVGKGRKHYEAAIANPEDAAKDVDPEDEPFENEMMWYVAGQAWSEKTGKPRDDYYQVAPDVKRSIKGEPFDEDTVYKQYPKLAKKFLSQ